MTDSSRTREHLALTQRQEAVLRYIAKHEPDVMNEGNIADDLWPLILNVRAVVDALCTKGTLCLGDWWDEVGYDLHLTVEGRAWLEARDA